MDLLNDLTAIGFTEYEAKVYLALLRESPATGYQLGKAAGIPRSMVYEALGRLHTRGAILKTEERRAALYRPLPPDALLDGYEQEHQRLMHNLRDSLMALYTAPEEERVWSISGRKAMLTYAIQMLQQAEREIWLVLADPELDALRAEILAAYEREVSVNVLLTGQGKLAYGQVKRHPPLESALQQLDDVMVAAVDKQVALIASTGALATATVTNNRHLVLIAHQFVWMELFTQRIYQRLGGALLDQLDPEDRQIFESIASELDKEEESDGN